MVKNKDFGFALQLFILLMIKIVGILTLMNIINFMFS